MLPNAAIAQLLNTRRVLLLPIVLAGPSTSTAQRLQAYAERLAKSTRRQISTSRSHFDPTRNAAMRALVLEREGAPENVVMRPDHPVPQLQPGEVLVKVKAVGLNMSDGAGTMGWLKHVSKAPRVPGRDVVGVVERIEAGAISKKHGDQEPDAELRIGTEVWATEGRLGFACDGALAEYIVLPRALLSRKPASLSSTQAAALLTPWLCAATAVDLLAQVKAEDRVLVIGGRGAIGSAVCQMLRRIGCQEIYATSTSRRGGGGDAEVQWLQPGVRNLVLDSSKPGDGLREAFMDAAASLQTDISSEEAPGLDVVIDCAGYESPLNASLTLLVPNGGRSRVVVMATHRPDGKFNIDLRTLYMKSITLEGLSSGLLRGKEVAEVLEMVARGFDAGEYSYEHCGELEEIGMNDRNAVVEALSALVQRRARGKYVVVND